MRKHLLSRVFASVTHSVGFLFFPSGRLHSHAIFVTSRRERYGDGVCFFFLVYNVLRAFIRLCCFDTQAHMLTGHSRSLTFIHSHTLLRAHTLSCSITLTNSLTQALTLTLTHTHAHTVTHTSSHTHALTLTCTHTTYSLTRHTLANLIPL